jgi:hypothetical protein
MPPFQDFAMGFAGSRLALKSGKDAFQKRVIQQKINRAGIVV